jgi:hypothetical protein
MSKIKTKDVQTQSALGDAACYAFNAAELLQKIEATLPVTEDGKKIRIDFKTVIALLQVVWDQFKAGAKKCAGKEIEVPATGIVWQIARTIFGIIGFKP